MRLLSLRPERSASANSATSARFVRSEFYLKYLFCQRVDWTGARVQELSAACSRLLPMVCEIVMPGLKSTVRGCSYWTLMWL